jgi:hypothetical protein
MVPITTAIAKKKGRDRSRPSVLLLKQSRGWPGIGER